MEINPYQSPSSSIEHKLPLNAHVPKSMEKIFRAVIAINFMSFLIWYFQPYNALFIYDQSTLDGLAWNSFGGNEKLVQFSIWYFLFISSLAAVGLWFYLSFARLIFILLVISTLFMSPFLGLSVSTAIDSIFIYIVNLSDGVILYMSYFSSVSKKFSAK